MRIDCLNERNYLETISNYKNKTKTKKTKESKGENKSNKIKRRQWVNQISDYSVDWEGKNISEYDNKERD